MATRRQVAVFGLGQFGQAVALELTRLGHDVLAVDRNERVVQDIADTVTYAVEADVTDPDALDDVRADAEYVHSSSQGSGVGCQLPRRAYSNLTDSPTADYWALTPNGFTRRPDAGPT